MYRTSSLQLLKVLATIALIIGVACSASAPLQKPVIVPDWHRVAKALGKEGTVQGDVYRVSFPRSDLSVTVNGLRIRPALALGSWIAMRGSADGVMMMGDLVLTEDEVPNVINTLQAAGVEQTALHNHVLHESPRTMYLHIGGHGDPVTLATAVRTALATTATPVGAATSIPDAPDLPTDALDAAIGVRGRANGGVYQFSIPRRETIREHGMVVPASMGMATVLNFQPTGDGRAAITGDFVLVGTEVNPVIRELSGNGIEITALHSHMLDESPRLFFMHFWAHDDAQKLARGLGAALARTNSERTAQ
jgi:hypothetical protein